MVNIISNDCIGGYFYSLLKCENKNPFIYSAMSLSNFIKLINNYDTINFKNITLTIIENSKIFKRHNNTVEVTIDNIVTFEFIHHMYKEDTITPLLIKQSADDIVVKNMYYKNIIEYVKEKYFNRLQRMVEKPIFVFHDNSGWTDIDIQNLLTKITTKNNIILFTSTKNIKSDLDNIKIFYTEKRLKPEECAEVLKKIYL